MDQIFPDRPLPYACIRAALPVGLKPSLLCGYGEALLGGGRFVREENRARIIPEV
jgi:hypothetical protein